MSNGITVIGDDAKKARWRDWYIVLVASRTLIGRINPLGGRMDPVYEFQSGYAQTPHGLGEFHRIFPLLALTITGVTLPREGVLTIPLTDLERHELDGIETGIAEAEDLRKAQRTAAAGLLIVPGISLPKPPRQQ